METPTEPKQKPALPWHPLWALIFVVLLYFLAPILGGLVVSLVPVLMGWSVERVNGWLGNSVYAQFWFVLLTEAVTVGGLLLFLQANKRRLTDIGFNKPRLKYFGQGLAAYPVYFLMFLVVVMFVMRFVTGVDVDQEQQLGFDNVAGTLPLVVTFISLVVLPPLVEELLVRGFLFTSLRDRLKLWPAIMVTSFVFAVAHLPEGGEAGPLYIAAIDTFLLSLVLCWLRDKTGSLWPGITLHAIKNGIAYASLFIFVSS